MGHSISPRGKGKKSDDNAKWLHRSNKEDIQVLPSI